MGTRAVAVGVGVGVRVAFAPAAGAVVSAGVTTGDGVVVKTFSEESVLSITATMS